MRTVVLVLFSLMLTYSTLYGQFHTLKIPQASNYVVEMQRLAVTDITVTYHSPTVRDRDVWNDPGIIPQNGDPIAWRAGANMNTTIEFSTDVLIEGQPLAAGVYGFHVIPHDDQFRLLFAHNSQQWGSYYLDVDQDVSLQVEVNAVDCAFSEKLDYEFYPVSENEMILGLEWADKRIPFSVSVDLEKTVLASFRKELRGINTYRWEAWNDAANWCLNHDTNLEEALEWAERSINGGYYGFAANKNSTNLTTKARLNHKLGQDEALELTIGEVQNIEYTAYEANSFSRFLLDIEQYKQAKSFCETALEKFPNTWFIQLNLGISDYFLGDTASALLTIKDAKVVAPERFHNRIEEIVEEMTNGEYKLPGR
ncbi:DUF2911 domain-containing protein [Lewinella cohaerens]|uniref:DUF2911 domain-containing protein n=1 Tax=Lewinella cohaerens TaxID=70995 RepID=UPI00036E3D3B|nr:DUF2911 domain-containing protein [Lewinella cohaerens]